MQIGRFVSGAFGPAASARRFDVHNPATLRSVASVADCGPADAHAAIDAAAAAFPAWRALTALERARPLRRLAELMARDAERLADLCSQECGKPLAEARTEVAYAASFLDWFAEEGRRVYGETIPASDPAKRLLVLKRPCGVAAAITPWNFPLAMVTRKMGPALAAGCTQVVKPAEQTPLSALAIAELSVEAGLPAGVLNVVPGSDAAAIAAVFFERQEVRHVSFTGSTEVGKLLIRQSADRVVRVSLELGGMPCPGLHAATRPGRVLFVPHPALERARLVAHACDALSAAELAPGLGILTGDRCTLPDAQTPWFRAWEILESMPARERDVARWIAARGGGIVTVHTRGHACDPDRWQAALRGPGSEPMDVFVLREGSAVRAYAVRRIGPE
jgi:hypothetical protein